MKEIVRAWHLFEQIRRDDGHRFAVIEGNRDCNRTCSYCRVPQQYKREQEATVEETIKTIDWLYTQGYRLISLLGGEPLAPFKTKEALTFFEHTRQIVHHAVQKGMVVNVTTNGDYLTGEKVHKLKESGLDSLTLSLHTYSRPSLNRLLTNAKIAAHERVIPTIQTVLSTQTAALLPSVAAEAAGHGVFFSVGLVQEKGGGFSTKQGDESLLPPHKQQQQIMASLKRLKPFGFIRNNTSYLENAPNFYPNKWTCNPERDAFIHIGADGTIDICSDVRTNLYVTEIPLLSESEQWRAIKRDKVAHCGNCLFHCYYEAQNPQPKGDLPLLGLSALIKMGHAGIVEKWGQYAIESVKRRDKNVDWDLNF